MKSLLGLSLVIASLTVAVAQADSPITINGYSGKSTGSYHKMVNTTLAQLPKKYNVTNTNTAGSKEILEKVATDKYGFGYVQSDALMAYNDKIENGEITILSNVLSECIFVIVNKNSGIDSEDDLSGKKISVGANGSGAEVSLNYMKQLDPKSYESIETSYVEGSIALNQIKSKLNGIDAFMFVAAPTINNKFFKLVNEKDSDLKIIGIDDYSMNNKLPNGQSIYEYNTVITKDGTIFDTKVTTACTQATLISNSENPALNNISDIALTNKPSIVKAASR